MYIQVTFYRPFKFCIFRKIYYIYTYVCACDSYEKRSHEFEIEQRSILGRIWRERKERENEVIVLISRNKGIIKNEKKAGCVCSGWYSITAKPSTSRQDSMLPMVQCKTSAFIGICTYPLYNQWSKHSVIWVQMPYPCHTFKSYHLLNFHTVSVKYQVCIFIAVWRGN